LNWGFTLAARLLDFPGDPLYLTNEIDFGQAAAVSLNSVSGEWEKNPHAIPTLGLHFPYGRNVEVP
jgi:hypothetical protein